VFLAAAPAQARDEEKALSAQEAKALRDEVSDLRELVERLTDILPPEVLEQLRAPSPADEALEDRLDDVLDPAYESGFVAPLPEETPRTSEGTLMEAGRELEEAGLGQAFGGLYTKPFLQRVGRQAYVGGYMDLEYRDEENEDRTFRFHRLIPFIYADVDENVKFATEIEIEDGEDVSVEFAFVDVLITEAFNLRGGVILDPLGKFNSIHDSPVNDLTDRPLVNQYVIPTTLREPGAGIFGTLACDDSEKQVSYEAYVTSGFKGLMNDGTTGINTTNGLRDARSSGDIGGTGAYRDNNNSLAGVGRITFSPVLGVEIGASGHLGKYDERGRHLMRIVSGDLTVDGRALARLMGLPGQAEEFLSPFEFLVEGAHAKMQKDAFADGAGVPGRLQGYYAQANYHVFLDALDRLAERGYLGSGAHFTLIVRYDDVDLDGFQHERVTLGLNFRPNQYSTVLKFDYQFNTESGQTPAVNDDAFLISLATYF